jgi:hypothetical protein
MMNITSQYKNAVLETKATKEAPVPIDVARDAKALVSVDIVLK